MASKKRLWQILFLFYSKKGRSGKKERVENWIVFPHKEEGPHTDDHHEQRGAFSLSLFPFLSLFPRKTKRLSLSLSFLYDACVC